jgi:hypothetical protein
MYVKLRILDMMALIRELNTVIVQLGRHRGGLRIGRPEFDYRQGQEIFFRRYIDQTGSVPHTASYPVVMGAQLTTDLHLAPRTRIGVPYLYFSILLYRLVFN